VPATAKMTSRCILPIHLLQFRTRINKKIIMLALIYGLWFVPSYFAFLCQYWSRHSQISIFQHHANRNTSMAIMV
jgi:hypothetical protein